MMTLPAPKTLIAALAVVLMFGASSPAHSAGNGLRGTAYREMGRCGPYPRIAVKVPKGLCAGLVLGKVDGLRMPRTILPLAADRFIIADLGNWLPRHGALHELTLQSNGTPRLRTLFSGLDMPHGLALGSDGKVYVGEVGKVWRFDPANGPSGKPTRETVLGDLPLGGLHGLKSLAFGRDGALYVNHGAPSDRCEASAGGKPQSPCPELAGTKPHAAIWRARFDKTGKVSDYAPYARGLRNAVALAAHPRSGLILAADNGIDLDRADQPPEELNVVTEGADFGWPYCTGKSFRTPGVTGGKACSAYRSPAISMPAHAAPLGLLSYQGSLPALKDRWLVSWHGYRPTGHRIVSYAADKAGKPIGAARPLVEGWDAEAGVRPRGAPVGMATAADGNLWIAEDKNSTILVLRRDR